MFLQVKIGRSWYPTMTKGFLQRVAAVTKSLFIIFVFIKTIVVQDN